MSVTRFLSRCSSNRSFNKIMSATVSSETLFAIEDETEIEAPISISQKSKKEKMGLSSRRLNLPFNIVFNSYARIEWIDLCEFKLHTKHYFIHCFSPSYDNGWTKNAFYR